MYLITGPSRSGKSEWAEMIADKQNSPVVYLATGQENLADPDWQARIALHRRRRPTYWQTRVVNQDLAIAIQSVEAPACLLIDSLGGWVANTLNWSEEEWDNAVRQLIDTLVNSPCFNILVAEETGWGVIPAYPAGRQFRDRLGRLIRQVGHHSEKVYLVTGGYAIDLCQWGEPLPISHLKFS